uniref:Uncharacterized protein n=1 Tax=Arundo donax TaxID=35708 RepID=A0A0A9GQS3_ARUDO
MLVLAFLAKKFHYHSMGSLCVRKRKQKKGRKQIEEHRPLETKKVQSGKGKENQMFR